MGARTGGGLKGPDKQHLPAHPLAEGRLRPVVGEAGSYRLQQPAEPAVAHSWHLLDAPQPHLVLQFSLCALRKKSNRTLPSLKHRRVFRNGSPATAGI